MGAANSPKMLISTCQSTGCPKPEDQFHYYEGGRGGWLYKENNKVRGWNDVFTVHIPPLSSTHTYDFVVLTSLTHPRKILLLVYWKIGNRKRQRLIITPTYIATSVTYLFKGIVCILLLVLCRQVIDVQAEIEQLWSPLHSSLEVMNKVQLELRQMQLDRQRDIWTQMVSLLVTCFLSRHFVTFWSCPSIRNWAESNLWCSQY
jgi:hypothetical protein